MNHLAKWEDPELCALFRLDLEEEKKTVHTNQWMKSALIVFHEGIIERYAYEYEQERIQEIGHHLSESWD